MLESRDGSATQTDVWAQECDRVYRENLRSGLLEPSFLLFLEADSVEDVWSIMESDEDLFTERAHRILGSYEVDGKLSEFERKLAVKLVKKLVDGKDKWPELFDNDLCWYIARFDLGLEQGVLMEFGGLCDKLRDNMVSEDPFYFETRNTLAMAYLRCGRLKDAREILDEDKPKDNGNRVRLFNELVCVLLLCAEDEADDARTKFAEVEKLYNDKTVQEDLKASDLEEAKILLGECRDKTK
jgi:hypothetical protein